MVQSKQNSDVEAEKLKPIIHDFYIVDNIALGREHKNHASGCGCLLHIMEREHGFSRSKGQYERLFDSWGWKKNKKKEEWVTLQVVYDQRKKRGRESDVYSGGNMISAKKLKRAFDRHGYQTTVVRYANNSKVVTKASHLDATDFVICTPPSQSAAYLLTLLHNLPLMQSGSLVENALNRQGPQQLMHLSKQLFSTVGKDSLTTIQGFKLPNAATSLLPTQALFSGSWTNCSSEGKISQNQMSVAKPIATLTKYLLSNNMPGDIDAPALYQWVKNTGNSDMLTAISAVDDSTSKAMTETLFRLALENEDCATVELLLRNHVKFRGHKCRLLVQSERRGRRYPLFNLGPLQLALLHNNLPLTKMLIQAGILSNKIMTKTLNNYIDGDVDRTQNTPAQEADSRDLVGLTLHGARSTWYPGQKYNNIESDSSLNESNTLQILEILIGHGIKVTDQSEETAASLWHEEISCKPFPLAVAARFRLDKIVRFIVAHAAHHDLLVEQAMFALHVCLFQAVAEQASRMHSAETPTFLGVKDVAPIVEQLVELIPEGRLDPTFRFSCLRSVFTESPSLLDLAVALGCTHLVTFLRIEGYAVTPNTLEASLRCNDCDMFGQLLSAKMLDMTWQGMTLLAQRNADRDVWLKLASIDAISVPTLKYVVIAAIVYDSWELMALTECLPSGNCRMAILNAMVEGSLGPVARPTVSYRPPEGAWPYWGLFEDISFIGYAFSIPLMRQEFHKDMKTSFYHAGQQSDFSILDALVTGGYQLQERLRECLGFAIEGVIRECFKCSCTGNTRHHSPTVYNVAVSCIDCTRGLFVVQRLLWLGVDVNQKLRYDRLSNTILIAALETRNDALIELILDNGADINAIGQVSHAENYHERLMAPLDVAQSLKIQNWELWLAAIGACNYSSALSYKERKPHREEFWKSAREGNGTSFEMLLHNGPDVYIESAWRVEHNNEELQFWLHVFESTAVKMEEILPRKSLLEIAIEEIELDAVDQILARKVVNINYLDDQRDSVSPLMHAMLYLHDETTEGLAIELMERLLSIGASPNAGIYRESFRIGVPLSQLVSYNLEGIYPEGIDLKGIILLLQHGADPNTMFLPRATNTECYWTPLHEAVRYRDDHAELIVRSLLEHGADANPLCCDASLLNEDVPEEMCSNCLFELKDCEECEDCIEDITPLQLACQYGYKNVVDLLIEYKADVNAPAGEVKKATALQYACIYGYLAIVLVLIEHGADINAPGAKFDGRTALEAAAEHGRIDIVQLLLNAGADVHGDGQVQYERALAYASGNGHHALRELLEKHHDAGVV